MTTNSPTDTNQASEDIETGVLLRTQIRKTLHDNEIGFSMVNAGDRTPKQMVEELVEQLAGHCETLIRTEKLKLLAEVEELLIDRIPVYDGDDSLGKEYQAGYNSMAEATRIMQLQQRAELKAIEAKLEAEL